MQAAPPARVRRSSPGRNILLIGGLLGTVAVVAVLAGVPIPGTGRLSRGISGLFAADKASVLTYTVKKGTLPVTLTERGSLESSNNIDSFNEVEGSTTIITIQAEGTRVKKGELVCELDSAQLRDQLDTQKIAKEGASANLENAIKTHEVAVISVEEYEKGTYKQELESYQGGIFVAEADLVSKKESLEWAEKMAKYGYIAPSKLTTERLNYKRSQIALEEAKTKLRVLTMYTYGKTLKERTADVEKALSDKLAKETTFNLEKQKEEKLRRQIEKCKMYAPEDGLIVYANDPNQSMRGGSAPQIEEGAAVRERQKIFSLPDIANMQVNTKVNEAMVDRVKKGQRCRIRVEAQAGEPLSGTVDSVKPIADASSFFSSDVKVYTTIVKIDNSPATLRPGMSAQVEMLIEQLDDVIAVPVQAILSYGGKDRVFVRQGDTWDRREVTLGTSNDKLVEVKEGLNESDEVALSPLTLMSEDEKQKAFGAGAKGATAKDWSSSDAAKSKDAVDKTDSKGTEGKAEKKKSKGQAGGGAPGGMPAWVSKFRNVSPEDREALKSASEEDRNAILKKAGFTDDEMTQMKEMGRGMGGGGGGFGGGPGGPGGGPGGPGGGPRP